MEAAMAEPSVPDLPEDKPDLPQTLADFKAPVEGSTNREGTKKRRRNKRASKSQKRVSDDTIDVTHISAWQIIMTKVQRIDHYQVAAKVLFYEMAEVSAAFNAKLWYLRKL